MPITGRFASRLTTGGLHRPLLRCRANVCRQKTIFAMHTRTSSQERGSSARRGYRYRTCKGASTKSRRTADGVCADRCCIRVERLRKGLTPVPAPALRDFQSLCSRARLPRGLTPPALVMLRERLPTRKRLLRCTNARPARERRASARRGVRETYLQHRYRTRLPTLVSSGNGSGVGQPAVGVVNTSAQTQACLFGGPPTVCGVIAVAFALIVTTGGLRPPLLCCVANVCRRNNDFRDAQIHVRLKSGGREPAVARSYHRCAARSECCLATSEHTAKSGGREPAVGVGNSIAQMQACLFGGPPTVCGGIAVAFALIGTTGG